jgi:hypothetical protein
VDGSLTNMANPPSLYLVGVRNPEQVINALKTLLSMGAPGDKADEPRTFLGRTIYALPLPGQRGGDAKMFITASGGYLAISDKTAMVEEYLRSADKPPKPLREIAGMAEAAQRVGGTSTGLFGYENQRESMRSAFKSLKSPEMGAMAMLLGPSFREWADFSLLPDFEKVAKYFGVSVFSGNANAEGMNLKFYSPRPAQLN